MRVREGLSEGHKTQNEPDRASELRNLLEFT